MSLQSIDFPSPAGPWRLHLYQPEPAIPGVRNLWAVEAQTREFREKVLPRQNVEWMINLASGPHHILHGNGQRRSTHREAWLSGLQRECLYIESPDPPRFIAASLHPAYAAALTNIAATQFTETVLELGSQPIYNQLRLLTSWSERFEALEQFLRTQTPQPNPTIVRAVDLIVESTGVTPIGQIGKALKISPKHFIHRFKETVGLAPKRFARLIRLEHAVTQSQTETVNWTTVAHECGYHDQAHFNREFRRFTGVTPTQFLATREASGQAMIDE